MSFYNERSGSAVFPTPIIGMVGLIEDTKHITTQDWKQAGDTIYLLGETKHEFGGSELQKLLDGKISGDAPTIDLTTEKAVQALTLTAIKEGIIKSAHDCAEGGLAVALAESSIGSDLGIDVTVPQNGLSLTAALFAESQSRIVISLNPAQEQQLEALAAEYGVTLTKLGSVQASPQMVIRSDAKAVIDVSIDNIKAAWKEAIPCYMSK